MKIIRTSRSCLALWGGLAIIAATASLTADTLVLLDGSKVEGKLRSCDDTDCFLGTKKIPIEKIARIELQPATSGTASSNGPSILMTDGTVRPGRFEGLSLGSVVIDGKDIDRENIAVIVLADIAMSKPAPRDVLLLVDGSARLGALATCNAASCQFDSQTIPLRSLRWIGLRQEGAVPPQADDVEDILFFKSSSAVTARMSAIDSGTVRSTHGSFPRGEVTWIHVAQGKPDTPKGEITTTELPPPSSPPPPPPPPKKKKGPTPTPTPAPQPSGSQHERVKPCPADKPLGGKVVVTEEINDSGCRGTTRTVLRFPLGPTRFFTVLQPWTSQLWDGFLATEISYEISSGGCTGLNSIEHLLQCDAPGGRRVGRVAMGPGAPHNIDFSPLKPQLSVSGSLPDEIWRRFTTEGKCVGPTPGHGAGPWAQRWSIGLAGFSIYPSTDSACKQGEENNTGFACVEATACSEPDPAMKRACILEGDRYAVIPFVGQSAWTSPRPPSSTNFRVGNKMQWEVCCGCAALPDAPDFDRRPASPVDKKNPCDELKALLGRMKALADASEAFSRDLRTAEEERAAVTDKIWGLDGALRKFFSSMLEVAASGMSESFKKLVEVVNAGLDLTGNSGEDVYNLLSALEKDPKGLATDQLKKAAERAAVKGAMESGNTVYKETKDLTKALGAYEEALKKSGELAETAEGITKGIDLAKSAKEYADKTSELADLIQEWTDANDNAKREKEGKDDIDRKMEDLQNEIDRARAGCPDGVSFKRRAPSAFQLVRYAEPPVASTSGGDTVAISRSVRSVRANLDKMRVEVKAATPWLLPFLFHETEGAAPELLAAMLKKAAPHFAAASAALDAAVKETKSLEPAIKKAIPEKTAAPGTPVAMLRHE
jgi:hypothetical protein